MLQALDVPWVALVPGASFRGLHDSLVNHIGNQHPQMLLCLHEGNAVAMAHGYAKASGRMMGAILHSNVGLPHGSMAIFNAWCDRVPMLILGATGPWDAAKRRPWIDWIHTASGPGRAGPRLYEMGQPARFGAGRLRCAPARGPDGDDGPVRPHLREPGRGAAGVEARRSAAAARSFAVPRPEAPRPSPETIAQAAALLSGTPAPVMLVGRGHRTLESWRALAELAEKVGARVVTDLKVGASFPTRHPPFIGPPGTYLSEAATRAVREADVILALDWVDLAGTLKQVYADRPITAKIVSASCDVHVHRGFSMDYFGLPPVDVNLVVEPDVAVPALLEACRPRSHSSMAAPAMEPDGAHTTSSASGPSRRLSTGDGGRGRVPDRTAAGWPGDARHFSHPLDYIGGNGGGGVGAGPGITVGAALALKGSGRVPIDLIGDGDYLMGITALWTAAHYRLPCVLVVCNNRSFYNDEAHQERVARMRAGPSRTSGSASGSTSRTSTWRCSPSPRAKGIGPVTDLAKLASAIAQGVRAALDGEVCVIDARVRPGYDADISGERAARQEPVGRT